MLRIGVLKKRYYCEQRNVTGRVNGCTRRAVYRCVKPYDPAACFGLALEKGLGLHALPSHRLRDYYRPLLAPPVDLLHTCNVVCETSLPWVATFEGAFPLGQTAAPTEAERRWMARNYRQLASPSCKRLLAFSHWAKDCTLDWMRRNHCPEAQQAAIRAKIQVLYPPQAVLITPAELTAKFRDVQTELRFVFVGRDFFRKGMYECLHALLRLRAQIPIRLTVVSALSQGYTYRVPHYSEAEVAEVRTLLRANTDWITWYDTLPNEAVLALCRQAHVGLLPTYRDSFGYSVLEMQACGCVVLSTDVFALPELNDETTGYLCPLRDAVEGLTDAPADALRPLLAARLDTALTRLAAEREALYPKAMRAVARIAAQHDPARHAEVLWNLYQECCHE